MASASRKPALRRHASSRRIIVVAVPPVDELDLVGPLQVFNSVNRLAGRTIYTIEVVTNADRLTVDGEGGVLTFIARHHFSKVEGVCDSVLLVCGLGTRSVRDAALSAWLKKRRSRCGGSAPSVSAPFCLRRPGCSMDAEQRRIGNSAASWRRDIPSVRVEHDPLWVKDGNIYTSAGVSASIDLALAWVEEDCGAALAHEAARELVLFLRRPGGQPQVSVSLASQASEMASIRELQIWIADHLGSNLSVEDLADRMAMSVRNFERVFTREVGTTPSQYVLQMRVEAARSQLERSNGGLKHVASAAGFGSVDVMRRAFVRLLGITPQSLSRPRRAFDRRLTPRTHRGQASEPAGAAVCELDDFAATSVLQFDPQDVSLGLTDVLDRVNRRFAPGEGAGLAVVDLRLAAVDRDFGVPVLEIDAEPMRMAMARLDLPGRHVDVEDPDERVLECELVAVGRDLHRIERVVRRLRPHHGRGRDDDDNGGDAGGEPRETATHGTSCRVGMATCCGSSVADFVAPFIALLGFQASAMP